LGALRSIMGGVTRVKSASDSAQAPENMTAFDICAPAKGAF